MKLSAVGWMSLVIVAFFAMMSIGLLTEPERDRLQQQHEIECVKAGGKMEFVFGNGATCTIK